LGIDELISILWRRRAGFALAAGIALAVVIVTTLAIPKAYQGTATIFVGQSIEGDLAAQTLDSTQGEQLARTFTTLASSPGIAELVGPELVEPLSRTELLDRLSVSPVERTQLLEINAEGSSPEEAAEIANTYAGVFVEEMDQLHEEGRVPTTVALSADAVAPTKPTRPNVPLYIGFGAVLSLLLATGVALALDRLDRSVRVGSDEETILGEPILARVPSAPQTLALPIDQRQAREQLADSLRVLRTNIELAPGDKARSLLVTSPHTGEGKTTISRELAMTIASDGDSVALVDLDLRRPSLDMAGTGTGIRRSATGISEVLAGRAELDEVGVSSSELPGLVVVHSGSLGANPSRLLRSEQAATALAELRSHFDWVVIDAPPVLIADDVLQLSHHVDGVVLVVDQTSTPLPAVRSAVGRMQKVEASMLGVILNKTASEASPYYMPEAQARAMLAANGEAASRRRSRDRASS
jgi:succinoglycan biosynthesis transport protein ExoP